MKKTRIPEQKRLLSEVANSLEPSGGDITVSREALLEWIEELEDEHRKHVISLCVSTLVDMV